MNTSTAKPDSKGDFDRVLRSCPSWSSTSTKVPDAHMSRQPSLSSLSSKTASLKHSSLKHNPSISSLNSEYDGISSMVGRLEITEEEEDIVILYETSSASIYNLPVHKAPRDYDSPPPLPSHLLEGTPDSSKHHQNFLIAKGTFQIYKMLGQTATYLKCGQFVHPILPKMRLWRILFNQFILPQPNPGRYWRLEISDMGSECEIEELESIFSQSCYYQRIYVPPEIPKIVDPCLASTPDSESESTVNQESFLAEMQQINNVEGENTSFSSEQSANTSTDLALDPLGFPLTPPLDRSSEHTLSPTLNSLNEDLPHPSDISNMPSDSSYFPLDLLDEASSGIQYILKDDNDHGGDNSYPSPTTAELNQLKSDGDTDCGYSSSSNSTLDMILDSFDEISSSSSTGGYGRYSHDDMFSPERLLYHQHMINSNTSSQQSLAVYQEPEDLTTHIHIHHHLHHYSNPNQMSSLSTSLVPSVSRAMPWHSSTRQFSNMGRSNPVTGSPVKPRTRSSSSSYSGATLKEKSFLPLANGEQGLQTGTGHEESSTSSASSAQDQGLPETMPSVFQPKIPASQTKLVFDTILPPFNNIGDLVPSSPADSISPAKSSRKFGKRSFSVSVTNPSVTSPLIYPFLVPPTQNDQTSSMNWSTVVSKVLPWSKGPFKSLSDADECPPEPFDS